MRGFAYTRMVNNAPNEAVRTHASRATLIAAELANAAICCCFTRCNGASACRTAGRLAHG